MELGIVRSTVSSEGANPGGLGNPSGICLNSTSPAGDFPASGSWGDVLGSAPHGTEPSGGTPREASVAAVSLERSWGRWLPGGFGCERAVY